MRLFIRSKFLAKSYNQNLIPMQKTVTRAGKTFQQTFHVKSASRQEPHEAVYAHVTVHDHSTSLQTPNRITDRSKLEALKRDMETNGWKGAPLVQWGDDSLITGSHRYAAAKMTDTQIPTVQLESLFEEAGLDFNELWEEEGEPSYGEPGMVYLLSHLPSDIREKYGIDLE